MVCSAGFQTCCVAGFQVGSDVQVRVWAVRSLGHFRALSPAVPGLLEVFKTGDNELRSAAARTLAGANPDVIPAFLPALVETLRAGENEVRYLSARTLEDLGTNALPVLPALLQATNDPSEMVQRAAARAARAIRGATKE